MKNRGQLNVLAISSFLIIILFVAFYYFSSESVKKETVTKKTEIIEVSDKSKQVKEIISNIIRQSIYEAVDAVAQSGGFSPDNTPEPQRNGIPIYVYKGIIINFPKQSHFEEIIRKEIRKRLESNLFDIKKMKKYGITEIDIPLEDLKITEDLLEIRDNFIRYNTKLHVSVKIDNTEIHIKEPFIIHADLRILRLYKIAKAFVHLYAEKDGGISQKNKWYREMEMLISSLMERDPTPPPPRPKKDVPYYVYHQTFFTLLPNVNPSERDILRKSYGPCIPCDRKLSYSYHAIKNSFAKNILVATSQFSSRARSEEYQKQIIEYLNQQGLIDDYNYENPEDLKSFMKGFYWEFKSKLGDFNDNYPNFNFTINSEKNDLIMEPQKADTDNILNDDNCECYKSYVANYSIQFPVEVTITDLLPTGKILGGSTVFKPLQFRFYIIPYLIKDGTTAEAIPGFEKPDLKSDITDTCSGKCSIRLKIEGPRKARVIIGDCINRLEKDYDSEENTVLIFDNAPCGANYVEIKPLDEDSKIYPVYRKNVMIAIGTRDTEIQVPKYMTISGNIYLNTTVYCSNTEKLACYNPKTGNILDFKECYKTKHFKKLTYIEGAPPAYIIVQLIPLEPELKKYETTVDKNGQYQIKYIIPGKYLFIAAPNVGPDNSIIYKVKSYAEIIDIKLAGDKTHIEKDIIMDSIYLSKIPKSDIYIPVYKIMVC